VIVPADAGFIAAHLPSGVVLQRDATVAVEQCDALYKHVESGA
jgi:hypothetical protein